MSRRHLLQNLYLFLLPYLFLLVTVVCGQQAPEHSVQSFPNPPARLFFFDDTQSVLYHDSFAGDVYVSLDEGKTWKKADGIPEGKAAMVIDHPFDSQYAFVLSNEQTHWRTSDKGKTWHSFEMPVPPAVVARPLSFHSDKSKYGYIIYQGSKCKPGSWGFDCIDVTYYTKSAFGDTPQPLLEDVTRCQFAHSSVDFKHDAHPDLIYCVAFDSYAGNGAHSAESSRLYSSTDFFGSDKKVEDLGIGKNAKAVVAFAIVSKFAVVALKDVSPSSTGEMLLYVTVDTKTWAKAQFPHASSATLRENAYTIVESTTHSLAVDVVLQDLSTIGTLFVSNSNGTFFVESLKDTNRNEYGFVDYERIYGVEGVGLANVVSNAQEVEGRGVDKELRTAITFDDGSNWSPIRPPPEDVHGKRIHCDPTDQDKCSLHLHSVTNIHNYGRVFSSPAPGLVMGVGSIGKRLLPYEECDTFLSTDAGVTWKMVKTDAHKYQIGDLGSVIVVVNDEEGVDELSYSLDFGKTWKKYKFDVKIRARGLTTLPDSTSQKFLLLGQVGRKDRKHDLGPIVVIQLDFSKVMGSKCSESDFEKWYARSKDSKECLMGHKQWYKRRKPDAECYVGDKFNDPVEHEDPCECTDADYECDYNYIRQGDKCVPAGPERIPAGECKNPKDKYMGSSGYRKIPGNTCQGGIKKDEKVEKDCSNAQPDEGSIVHQTFEFQSQIAQYAYFNSSTTILVRLVDQSMWQSSNEGYSWYQLLPNERFLAFYHHKYASDRAYLITTTGKFYFTLNSGQHWQERHAPTPPNIFGIQVLRFHPDSDKLIWTGSKDCGSKDDQCRAVAYYSRDNGNNWKEIESYVRNCAWVRDAQLDADPNEILCESYRDKSGNQNHPQDNPLELVAGTNYYSKKRKIFDHVVGFAKFSEYLVVAELVPSRHSLDLQVSMDGMRFATGKFPPSLHPEAHAYTVLESSTGSLFLHMTMSEPPAPFWGTILKSNSNGTYFGISLENVNRDDRGYVDFEKMIGLDGIALVNVVSNPNEATVSGHKKLQTRITHNDGSIWKPLNPPKRDSLGREYDCKEAKCSLHIHGYTERLDPRATYSSPSVVGLLMAVGNVGETLASYTESDTFLSRDAGFTWEEVHKDAHLWEFGDSGSILVMANDEEPTDHVLFSKDEGLTWREYQFTKTKMRVRVIVTVPTDTSRRFILLGHYAHSSSSIAVHLDFSSLTLKQCQVSIEEPGKDDFELWSPAEEREEICLFGRHTLYHRRRRDVDCVVGQQPKAAERIVKNCACKREDFECEFNYVKNENNECVLVSGTTPLPDDDSCRNGDAYWYTRTPYRKIPYSSCEGGDTRHLGTRHVCPGFKAHGAVFWMFVIMVPFAFTALVGYYYYRRSGLRRGTIRLPGDTSRMSYRDSGALETLASVPWFLLGLAGVAWEWVSSKFDHVSLRSQRGYRNLPIDEDAQVLRFEDEE